MIKQRANKIAELRHDSMRLRDRADALDMLAARIRNGALPVERWREFWSEIADECRLRAAHARRTARDNDEHAVVLDEADAARIKFERTR